MDGVMIVNKPKGFSSNDVVQKMRKIMGTRQVGHCGTLDPLATGVLPILVGQGTKISKYLVEHKKTYIATIQLGEKTRTADSEGEVIETKPVKELDEKEIEKTLSTFLGKQMQIPPIYSAIKKEGKKLYEYAREGIEITVEPREIEITEIKLIEWKKEAKQIIYQVTCSKGTYIRSLCEDIASRLETVGFMKELTRIKVNEFPIEKAMTIEEIEQKKEIISKYLITIEELFEEKEKIILEERKNTLFLNGVMLTVPLQDEVYRIYHKKEFVGLGIVKDHLLKRDVIIH